MDIRRWLQERTNESKLATKHWKPIFQDSIFSSLSWWIVELGFMLIVTLISIGITIRQRGEIVMSDYFPPIFGWGVLIILFITFLYQVFVEVGKVVEKLRVTSDKYTWNDVVKNIGEKFEIAPIMAGLDIINKKPYDIHSATVQVVNILKGRFPHYDSYPLQLAWTGSRGILWGGRKLSKNGGGRGLLFAGWLDKKDRPVLFTGMDGEQHAIELEENTDYVITLEWYGEIDGHKLDSYENSYKLKFNGNDFSLQEVKTNTNGGGDGI